jgi:hypothetical protein
MKEFSSKKCNLVLTDSLENTSSITSKKNWQAPRLRELNYSETNSGGVPDLEDGGGWAS